MYSSLLPLNGLPGVNGYESDHLNIKAAIAENKIARYTCGNSPSTRTQLDNAQKATHRHSQFVLSRGDPEPWEDVSGARKVVLDAGDLDYDTTKVNR